MPSKHHSACGDLSHASLTRSIFKQQQQLLLHIETTNLQSDLSTVTQTSHACTSSNLCSVLITRDTHTMLLSFTGEYSGWVWIIPASNYDTTEPLPSWPPATEGPAAVAKKWFGSLKAGRIFLARQTTLEDSDVLPVVDIPLSGCTVRLVTEGLTGQTAYIASSSSAPQEC